MPADVLQKELDDLLNRDIGEARKCEQSLFDEQLAASSGSIVIYGAGKLGRKTAAGLRLLGSPPVAFIDANPALWGSRIDELPVYSVADALAQFGPDALVLIGMWSPGKERKVGDVRKKLIETGFRHVLSFAVLFWKAPSEFLPHYRIDPPHHLLAAAEDVHSAFALMADEHSRREFVRQVAWLMSDDFPSLEQGTACVQYFPDDILQPSAEDALVDCGAFDGDTIREFLAHRRSAFSGILAFEPDPGNFDKLRACIAGLPPGVGERIRPVPFALGDRDEMLSFAALGTPVSMISSSGEITVPCRRLDDVIGNFIPTYIKMDLEGAEPAALRGAADSIRRHQPSLAICVYHRQSHLWELPLLMNTLCTDHRFFLRRHGDEFGDVVCYAIAPRHRAGSGT